MQKKNVIKMDGKNFVVLHNNLNKAIWKIGFATNDKRGMTADETMEVFKLIYPLAKDVFDLARENNFCVCGIAKQ